MAIQSQVDTYQQGQAAATDLQQAFCSHKTSHKAPAPTYPGYPGYQRSNPGDIPELNGAFISKRCLNTGCTVDQKPETLPDPLTPKDSLFL